MTYLTNSFDEKVVELLKGGGIGLVPTDTIYGLSASGLHQSAVEETYKLKERDLRKPFVVLVSSKEQLQLLGIDKLQTEQAMTYWPAPLTIVFKVGSRCPEYLHRGGLTLAVRMPDSDELLRFIESTGPIISTSANPDGQPPAISFAETQAYFGDRIDFYVDRGPLQGAPSTVAKLDNNQLVVLRQGSFKIDPPSM